MKAKIEEMRMVDADASYMQELRKGMAAAHFNRRVEVRRIRAIAQLQFN